MDRKTTYIRKLKNRLKMLAAEIDMYEAKATQSGAVEGSRYGEVIQRLERKRKALRDKLEQIESHGISDAEILKMEEEEAREADSGLTDIKENTWPK